MNFEDKMACISPVRMSGKSEFRFECHSKIKCFTHCCRGINITLTPYDVIRLKNRLKLSSRAFLSLYTQPHLLEKTDLPMITLKLLDDKHKSCPFVRKDKGCIIYEDRPTSCRYYPLGTATLQHKEDADDKDFFFFVNEPHCRGFEENKKWSVNKWRENQEIDTGDLISAKWADLVVKKRSFPSNIKLTERAKQMFFLASYDIDKFREFVFDTSFLKRFNVDDETKDKMRENEIVLLKFGLSWIERILFKDIDSDYRYPSTSEKSG